MGVITKADELRDETRELINKSYKNILEILDSDTWGSRDFKEEYIDQLREAALMLLRVKRIL